jgi:ribose transport system ATP-binding protein
MDDYVRSEGLRRDLFGSGQVTTTQPSAPALDSILALSNVWKGYGGQPVLKDVSIDLRGGQVHMLLGENGAGKSTLVGLLIGAHAPDSGVVSLRGRPVEGYTPFEARRQGVNAVLQDFSLAPSLTVAENYFLGREQTRSGLLRKDAMRRETAQALAKLGIRLDVDAPVETLGRPHQQLLEIARALGGKPGALILDEPTATLSHEETEILFEVVRKLRAEGWAILYITHRLEEVRELGDCITLLRDGHRVAQYPVGQVSDSQLVRDMVGRPLENVYPEIPSGPAGEALALIDVVSAKAQIHGVSLTLNYGEIVGVGGLVGCGKGDLGNLVFGLVPIDSGNITVDGAQRRIGGPRDALKAGIVYLPQDRRGEALALNRSAAENMTLELVRTNEGARRGFLRKRRLAEFVEKITSTLDIRPRRPTKPAQEFSGGNQQKLVLARAFSRPRKIYIFCEPTAGIDVGARVDFYKQLASLCREGAAVLLISSDLQELIHLSHRIYVMHSGRVSAELRDAARTEHEVARWSFGGTADSAPSFQSRESVA